MKRTMQTKITFLLLCFFSVTLSAQEITQLNAQFNKLTFSGHAAIKACYDTPWLQKESHQLALLKCNTDPAANEHCRYQILLKNIPIRGMEITSHYNPRTGVTDFIMPRLIPNEKMIPGFSPRITYDQAIERTKQQVVAEQYNHLHASANATEKGLLFVPKDYNFAKPEWVLAYEIDVHTHQPWQSKRLTLNAETGAIIFEENRICSFNGSHEADETCSANASHEADRACSADIITGTAETRYHGTREIETTETSGGFLLNDQTRGTGISTLDLNTNSLFFDDDNVWDNANAAMDEVAGDIHWGSAVTFDFYNDLLGYNGLDGNGRGIESHVHLDEANAFWDGTNTLYGDGEPGSDLDMPLTYINVISHEMTHAVTEFSSGLIYAGESGAMNESISDIMGVSVENHTNPGSVTWRIGEAVSSTGFYFRNMANPNELSMADTYDSNFWDDGAGVHTNSSIGNYWFYLLVTGETDTNDVGYDYVVDQLGWETAYTIAHTTWVNYLTPSSTYLDCALFSIEAAEDLYGSCSNEVSQVRNAWAAVNVLTSGSEQAIQASTQLVCTIPTPVTFSGNGDILDPMWDFGDGNTSTDPNPEHTYTQNGSYTVSLSGMDCNNDPFMVIEENLILVDTNSTSCDTIIMMTGGMVSSAECFGILIDDGGIAGNYQNSVSSVLTVNAPDAVGYMINLDFFETEGGFDFLRIEADNGNGFELVDSYSGISTGENLLITGSTIRFTWNTDGSVTRPGFVVSWECILPVIPTPDFMAEDTLVCSEFFQIQDLSTGFPDSWTWLLDGVIVSMEQNPLINVMTPGLHDLGLIACNSVGCDTLIRTDYLHYDTTLSICALIVMEDGLDAVSTRCAGSIIDDGEEDDYMSNVLSILEVAPPSTGAFMITFDFFETEGYFDFLTILADRGNGFEQVDRYTGILTGQNVMIEGASRIRFEWDTDGSVTRPGFIVSWACLPPQAVVVDFTTADTLVCASIFQMEDLSQNIPDTWTWFLDGTIVSMEQNPVIDVVNPGTYEVGLIACNDIGCDTLVRPDYLVYDTTFAICDLIVMEDDLDLLVNTCEGIIIDDGGIDDDYSNNVEATLEVAAPGAIGYLINFEFFNTEGGFDDINLLADTGNGFEVVDNYSGAIDPNTVNVSGSRIRFDWDTDGSVTRAGFQISWTCIDGNQPPIVSPTSITEDCSNTYEFRSNSPNATTVTWDFGDGNTGSGDTVTHTYFNIGDYTVTGVATNDFGTNDFSMDVSATLDNVRFEAPDTMMVNELANLIITSHSENDLNGRRWEIDGVIVSFEHEYPLMFEEVGLHEVTVFATDLQGCVSSHTEIVFVSGTTSVADTELSNITLSPNPTSGQITLFNLDQVSTSVRVSVLNLVGQQLLESQPINGVSAYPIDLSAFPAGVYFVRIQNDNLEYLVKKVIKH